MSKIGRNDPCPCGSGKKYKHCHLPIDEAAQAEQRRLRHAVDTLMPRIIEAARELPETIPPAFERFWNGKYNAEQLVELDDLEDRGAERFLTWFAFDYPLDDGNTLVERLAAGDSAEPALNDDEARLIKEWPGVRLRPYTVESALKGQGMSVRDLLDEAAYEVEDHAASRRVQPGDVLVAHLLPAGNRYYIGGAAAHLTADTREKLREYAALHLEAFSRDHPGADWASLLRAHSEVLNHFVMALPVEEPDPSILENIITQTKVSLQLAGESLGIGTRDDEANNEE
jgi:SEC-C motif